MDITSLIKKRAVFLKTGDATKYLNIRSQEISGDALNITGDKVRELAKTDKLKHNKTSSNGNFLFKTSWLEQYLKSSYGIAYTGPEIKGERFSEFDPNANSTDKPVIPTSPQGLFKPQPKVEPAQPQQNALRTDFLSRIRNSPPLIYLGALLLGFAAGSGTNIADRLIGMGYFSDRISIADPINETDARRLVATIRSQEPDTLLGRELRGLQANQEGPFKLVEKTLRVHLLDSTNTLFEPEYQGYVVNLAAVVCGSSEIAKSNILINASNIILTDQKANGLVKFNAMLTHPNVCTFGSGNQQSEGIVVNRETFDRHFNIDTNNRKFVDVIATIKLG